MTKKKKPNKQQRDKQRAHDAAIYEQGFNHGYLMGFEQGEQGLLNALDRERKKWANLGR